MLRNSNINYKALSDQYFGCFCGFDSIVIYRFVGFFIVCSKYLFLDSCTGRGPERSSNSVILKLLSF